MASLASSTLRLAKPNPFFTKPPFKILHGPTFTSSFTTRATSDDSSPSNSDVDETTRATDGSDTFENRLSQVRLRYRSGAGKKAEVRKTRKGQKTGSGSGSSVFLPPIPLKEPVSEGLNVEFGFSPYSERVNGRIAILGLTALLLVELATGKSVINYHTPAIVFIQVYFVAAVSALYLKFEKEKVSVWPQ
ncbi:unnamed protein product [Withania somnifera]